MSLVRPVEGVRPTPSPPESAISSRALHSFGCRIPFVPLTRRAAERLAVKAAKTAALEQVTAAECSCFKPSRFKSQKWSTPCNASHQIPLDIRNALKELRLHKFYPTVRITQPAVAGSPLTCCRRLWSISATSRARSSTGTTAWRTSCIELHGTRRGGADCRRRCAQ